MQPDRSATIAVERAACQYFPFGAPWVYIDGRLVGLLRKGRGREFPVAAGEHIVSVVQGAYATEAISFCLGAGDRVDVVCNSIQQPPDRWHVLAVWFILLHGALDQVGSIIPPIRVFVREYLIIVTSIVMTFGLIRLLLYVRRE